MARRTDESVSDRRVCAVPARREPHDARAPSALATDGDGRTYCGEVLAGDAVVALCVAAEARERDARAAEAEPRADERDPCAFVARQLRKLGLPDDAAGAAILAQMLAECDDVERS